jgi:hypothetical protein
MEQNARHKSQMQLTNNLMNQMLEMNLNIRNESMLQNNSINTQLANLAAKGKSHPKIVRRAKVNKQHSNYLPYPKNQTINRKEEKKLFFNKAMSGYPGNPYPGMGGHQQQLQQGRNQPYPGNIQNQGQQGANQGYQPPPPPFQQQLNQNQYLPPPPPFQQQLNQNQYLPPPPPFQQQLNQQQQWQAPPQGYFEQNPGLVSPCNGRKKALLIGINYTGTQAALRGCINDVQNVKEYLCRVRGWPSDPGSIVVLSDDQQNPTFQPTRQNIIEAMKWLSSCNNFGDSLFFHFSGHGGQKQDV